MSFTTSRSLFISLIIVYSGLDSSSANNCSSTEFTCSDGSCISLDKVCDSAFDCKGGYEEINCTATNCPEGLQKCSDGSCKNSPNDCEITTEFQTTKRSTEASTEPTSTSKKNVITTKNTISIGIETTVSTESGATKPQNNVHTSEGTVNLTGTSLRPTKTSVVPEETNKYLYLLFLLFIPLIVIVGILLWCYRKDLIRYWLEKGHDEENSKVKYRHE